MGDYNQFLAEHDLKINIEKSVNKRRLCYRFSGGEIFSEVLSYLFAFVFLGILNAIVIKGALNSPISFAWLLLIIIIDTWMILNIILRDSLVRIEGNSIEKNKADILLVLKKYYPKLDFQINDEKILRSFKGAYHPIWGRVVTAIFDGDAIYLNITKLGKSDSPTMIHGLLNYIKAKRIARYYRLHYS